MEYLDYLVGLFESLTAGFSIQDETTLVLISIAFVALGSGLLMLFLNILRKAAFIAIILGALGLVFGTGIFDVAAIAGQLQQLGDAAKNAAGSL